MSYCADLTFGLSPQSLAILHLLAQRETEFAEVEGGHYKVHIETTPWYNGLERGVALQIFRGWNSFGPCRVIVFGERREDDKIFVEYWDPTEAPFNAPTIEQREQTTEDLEVPRDTFSRRETYRAADRVYELMAEFYTQEEVETPDAEVIRFPPQLRRVY